MGSYLVAFFAWIVVLFIIGHVASRVLTKAPDLHFYSIVFRNVFVGYVLVITTLSVFQTQFKTINTVLILIGGLIFWDMRRKPLVQNAGSLRISFRHVITIIGGATACFLIPWFTISNPQSYLGFFYNQTDYVLYSKIAESLMIHGQENGFTVLNALDSYYTNPEPYHFFDLWGAAAASRMFSINVLPALFVIVYPTFYLLCFTGCMLLIKRDNYMTGILAFAFLWVGGIALSFIHFHPFFRSLSNLSHNLFTPSIYKLSYFYVFLLSGFLLFRSGHIIMAVLVCLGLPVANIVTFPTLIPSILMFLTFMYFFSPTDKNQSVAGLAYTLLVAGAIVLFYSLNQRESGGLAGAEISKPFELVKGIFNSTELSLRRNIIVGGILSLLLIYSPYIPLIALNWKRLRPTTLAVFPVIVITVALLVWAGLFKELNSSQIFSNIAIVVTNLTIIISLCEIANLPLNACRTSLIGSVILVIAAVGFQIVSTGLKMKSLRTQSHSDTYLQRVENTILPNSIIGSIRSVEEMTPFHDKYNAVYPLGNYLLLQKKNSFSVNISDLSTPIDSTSDMNLSRSIKAVRDGLFYRYSKFPDNVHLCEEDLMEKFVNQYNIRYLIVSKSALLPEVFRRHAKTIISDTLSGEQFVALF